MGSFREDATGKCGSLAVVPVLSQHRALMRTTALFTTLLAIAACQPQSEEPTRDPGATEVSPATAPSDAQTGSATQTDPAAVRAEIEGVRKAWMEAAERDDAAAVAQLYSDDGVVIDPVDYVPVQGREAIQKVLAAELPIVNGLELRSQDSYASGDLAYDYGEFTEQVTPPGEKPIMISGRYLIVLRLQEDGAWKLVKKIAVMSPRDLVQSSAE
jgi:uncharacterized protein (TIGR02246 family)